MNKVLQCILVNNMITHVESMSEINRLYTYTFINQCTTVFNVHQYATNMSI